ncbi:DUF4395 domain-containing protein [Candidatus Peribacteria bacterium]|nr:DUF4395 domain-containing protein [Candidatus Peribacteria bacterium]
MPYGSVIPGLEIHGVSAPYPVVNERAIRATAGLMLVIGLSTFWYVFLTKDYTPMPYVVGAFWLDFFLKTVLGPQWSYFGLIGRWLVRGQRAEYVGAVQKRFAWGMGLLMASAMLVVGVWLEIRGIAPMAICLTCLFFMWLESAAGVCVGCKIYNGLVKRGILPRPQHQPACPGGSCSIS